MRSYTSLYFPPRQDCACSITAVKDQHTIVRFPSDLFGNAFVALVKEWTANTAAAVPTMQLNTRKLSPEPVNATTTHQTKHFRLEMFLPPHAAAPPSQYRALNGFMANVLRAICIRDTLNSSRSCYHARRTCFFAQSDWVLCLYVVSLFLTLMESAFFTCACLYAVFLHPQPKNHHTHSQISLGTRNLWIPCILVILYAQLICKRPYACETSAASKGGMRTIRHWQTTADLFVFLDLIVLGMFCWVLAFFSFVRRRRKKEWTKKLTGQRATSTAALRQCKLYYARARSRRNVSGMAPHLDSWQFISIREWKH